jgi:hypothetical protein
MAVEQRSPVEAIPTPDEIRERLARLARERSLLKTLLRLALRKAQEGLEEKDPKGGLAHAQ